MALKLHFLESAMALRPGPLSQMSSMWGSLCRSGASRLASLTSGTKRLVSDERGVVMTEYVVVVGVVSLAIASALVAVGPLLLASYERSRAILIGPFP